jgi:hypothetical protein
MVHGYDCAFERTPGFKSKNTSPMGVLLLEFFHFYGFLFDFEHDVVSIKMGQDPPPKKSAFKYPFNGVLWIFIRFRARRGQHKNGARPPAEEIRV